MKNIERNIHVIYRHTPASSERVVNGPKKDRPDWFSYETCFRNLLQTVKFDPLNEKVKILILFDGSADEFIKDFSAGYYANELLGLDLQLISGGSNAVSFLIALDLIRKSTIADHDLIYFMENDYIHQHGWVSKLLELYRSMHTFDFVSLYDHRDKYIHEMYPDLPSHLIFSETHHWRTTPSTCGTFVLEKVAILRDYDVWTSNLRDAILFPKLIRERGRVLLTPVPGLATHCMINYISPTIDWEHLVNQANQPGRQ